MEFRPQPLNPFRPMRKIPASYRLALLLVAATAAGLAPTALEAQSAPAPRPAAGGTPALAELKTALTLTEAQAGQIAPLLDAITQGQQTVTNAQGKLTELRTAISSLLTDTQKPQFAALNNAPGARGGARQGGGGNPTRIPNTPGTPLLIPAGPNAEAEARAVQKKSPNLAGPAADTKAQGAPGANPPLKAEGDFVIGPNYVRAPELTAADGVPRGTTLTFSMSSADSKIYPGIGKSANGTVDPNNPYTLLVNSFPKPYTRTITVYVPPGYVPGTPAPVLVGMDGAGYIQANVLNNLIAQHRIPALVGVGISTDGSDAQGSERGLEYDTMSGKFAEFVETEVFPLVEKNAHVTLTKDPEGRATIGGSSGAACAFTMAWYHPDLFRRVISYSGTFVNQQWPFNPETPHGAWGYVENIIAQSAPKPIRIWMQVGDKDLFNPNVMRDNMHDWVEANHRMAAVLRAKGYHYQYAFSLNAGHVDGPTRNQTYAEAYEWVWQGYQPSGK